MNTLLLINIGILAVLLIFLLAFKKTFNNFCNDIIETINFIVGNVTKGVNDVKNWGNQIASAF